MSDNQSILESDQTISIDELKSLYEQIENKVKQDFLLDEQSENEEIPFKRNEGQQTDNHSSESEHNNDEPTRFPSDLVYAQMSFDVYTKNIRGQEILFGNGNEKWIVERVFNEPSEDTKNLKKGSLFSSVIYLNETKKQIVLAHRGIKANLVKLFKSNGQLKFPNVFNIVLQEMIPQLKFCYEITEQAVKMANEKGFSISFTGYSNGAWLAEHSIFYTDYHKPSFIRAVLFESPGIFYPKISLENNRQVEIVNYLTSPNLVNTLAKHAGQVYRIYIENEIERDEIAIKFLQKFKFKVPVTGQKFCSSISNSKFITEGLLAMLTHKRLKKIIEAFDIKTGQPKYCEMVTRWPLIKIEKNSINTFAKSLSKFSHLYLSEIASMALTKSSQSSNLSEGIKDALFFSCSNGLLPSIHILLNIFVEIANDLNINNQLNLSNFDSTKYFKKSIIEEEKVSEENLDEEIKDFGWIKLINQYQTIKVVKIKEKKLSHESENKIDYFLYWLQKSNNLSKYESILESPNVLQQIQILKDNYEIHTITRLAKNFDNVNEFYSNKFTIGEIREKMIRILYSCPKLIEILSKKKKFYAQSF